MLAPHSLPRPAALLALLGLLPLVLFTSSCCRTRQEQPADTLILSEAVAAKVDPEVRRSASKLLDEGRGDELIPVLVRVSSGTESRAQLQAAGMQVDSLIGEVVSGFVPARALAAVAALDAVVQVQQSREMEIK